MLLLRLLALSLFASNALSIPPPEASGSIKSVVDGSGVNGGGTDGSLASVPLPHATSFGGNDDTDDSALDDVEEEDDSEVDGTLASIPHFQATGLVDDNGTDESGASHDRIGNVNVDDTDGSLVTT